MKIKTYQWLLIIIAFSLFLRLIFFTGADSSDELEYYQFANQVNQGTFGLGIDHFKFRVGTFYPTALFFGLFGVNELTGNLLTLLASIAGIILIYFLGKEFFNEKTGLLAAFLLSFYPLDVVYSTRLLPDLPSALFMGLGVLLFLYGEKYEKKQNIYFIFSGFAIGAAYLIKEVSLLMGLFFLAYFIYKRKFKSNYLLIGIGVGFAVLFLMAYSYTQVGDPFFQYKSTESEQAGFMKSLYPNYFTANGLASRLFLHYPYFMLTDGHFGFFFFFIGVALIFFLVKKKTEAYVPILWMLSLFLYLNFGTSSLKEYVPFPVIFRHLSIITLPALLLTAYFMTQITFKKLRISLIALLLLSSIFFIYSSHLRHDIDNLKSAQKYLSTIPEKAVYTDERTSMTLNYLFGFKREVQAFNKFDYYNYSNPDKNLAVLDLKGVKGAYIVINSDMITRLPLTYSDMKFPDEIFSIPKSWKLEKEFGSGSRKVLIYST